ncbi:putative methyltransferase-domain-containing protein [Pisolithus sp. B1]|nr:putative methyltransferase-domain-containing protein [Pisolithus sp. B1]
MSGSATRRAGGTFDAKKYLLRVLHAYSALIPPRHLTIPPIFSFSNVHNFFLIDILLDDHLNKYPPAQDYQRSFWKWALERLENLSGSEEDNEIDERMYQHYTTIIPSVANALPSDSYITHYWKPLDPSFSSDPTYERITLLESRTTIAAGTTGLRTWRASLALAQYLIEHTDLVTRRDVLELGSGTGFLGILIASLQLRFDLTSAVPTDGSQSANLPTIYLTDVNPCVLDRCQHNTKLPCNRSSFHPNVEYRLLDWCDAVSSRDSHASFLANTNAEIILGADVVFDPAMVPPLVTTLSVALSQGRAQMALIAITIRNLATFSYFLREIGRFPASNTKQPTLSAVVTNREDPHGGGSPMLHRG